jgi:hypothetical protein
MPAATYPDKVTLVYWTGEPERIEHCVLHLLEQFTEVDSGQLQSAYMVDALFALIAAACPEHYTYELTTVARDYFGQSRPYNCAAVAEFNYAGDAIDDVPAAYFRVLDSAQVKHYAGLLRGLLRQPGLFDSERDGIEDAVKWLDTISAGRVLLLNRQG